MTFVSSLYRIVVVLLSVLAADAQAGPVTYLTNKLTTAMSDLPRHEKLPLFNPHRKSFTCVYQEQHVPPIDPQAELLFQQALTLDDRDVYYKHRDYPKMFALYRQAAERGHWKAMLNLASLILSSYPVPEHDPEIAVRWVERAMKLGVADAYDMMGVYHQRGVVRGGGATAAYAFFQRAADMGSPSALTFLGDKLGGTYDYPAEGFWGNRLIAIEMLQCAVAQGYGDAAYELALLQSSGYSETAKKAALNTFHDGVAMGSAKCAHTLSSEFRGFDLNGGTNLVGYVDSARAERYSKIGDALEHYGGRLKLPNLDKVLPLPPAPLPKWDGNVKTLIDAAKAVTPPPKPNPGASLEGREHIPEGHGVLSLAASSYAVTGDETVPKTGYWLATYGLSSMTKSELRFARSGRPERYRTGERFEAPMLAWLTPDLVQWHFLGDAQPVPPSRDVFLKMMVDAGWIRQVSAPASTTDHCHGLQSCPITGVWEGRIAGDHPLAALYNVWHRQAYVEQGQLFPAPERRSLDIAAEQVRWTYLGSPNRDGRAPGVREISV
jgi:TPR repeat protein